MENLDSMPEQLLERYKQGTCTPEEKLWVEHWYNQQSKQASVNFEEPDYERLRQEIWAKLPPVLVKQEMKAIKPVHRLIWHRVASAAAIFITLSAGIYFFTKKTDITPQLSVNQRGDDVMPGGNKAILKLSDGSQIVLDNAKNGLLTQQGNSAVTKLANGQLVYNKTKGKPGVVLYNTMTTPRGGQYKLTLPDGTNVWLNAASSITYPTTFIGKQRNVSITGEAYFEVAKNREKPFYVKSSSQTIQVLGTHFNINAYEDEHDVKTTLLEGCVKVSLNNTAGSAGMTIKPNEQTILSKGNLSKSTVDVDDIVAWKNGETTFNEANIKSVMRQIARWYDIEVSFNGNIPEERLFTGEISRNARLSEVLKILELSKINFKIEGKKLIVSP
ncbi:FecR family protein [Pedobacter sp. PAMC26386]|nr:FecR family protein [Pedobacter sp. PAMC26386]